MAEKLKHLNFRVVEGDDLDESQLRAKVSEFSQTMIQSSGDVSLVYHAGHGVTYDGENYLLPTDIEVKGTVDLDVHALAISSVLKQMNRNERAAP